MKSIIISGLIILFSFSVYGEDPKSAFQKEAAKAVEKAEVGLLGMKNQRISDFVLTQAILFGLEVDLGTGQVIIETESTGDSADGKNKVENFSAYFWANWTEDGSEKRGSCRLQASFSVSAQDGRTNRYIDKDKKARLRILLNSENSKIDFRDPKENPVCYAGDEA